MLLFTIRKLRLIPERTGLRLWLNRMHYFIIAVSIILFTAFFSTTLKIQNMAENQVVQLIEEKRPQIYSLEKIFI
jgi:hypothetical protein